MPYKLEKWGDKAIVVNAKTGHHFSTRPLPLPTAKKQMAALYIHADHLSSRYKK